MPPRNLTAVSPPASVRPRDQYRPAEDLTYPLQFAKADPVGEIRMAVFDPHKSWGNVQPAGGIAGLAQVRVQINGQDLKQSAATDRNGRYLFSNLPPGDYQVPAKVDGYALSMPLPTVKLHAKGCAEIHVGRAGFPSAWRWTRESRTRPRTEGPHSLRAGCQSYRGMAHKDSGEFEAQCPFRL